MLSKLKHTLLKNQIITICCLFFAVFTVLFFYRIFYANYLVKDTLEHIQAAWLISEGKLPYRDFFEHHFPLLWFLLAPITAIFHHQTIIFPIVKILAITINLCSIFLIYKITKNFLYNQVIASLSAIILLSVPDIWQDIQNIRPDHLMTLSFLLGIYNFFSYATDKKRTQLIASYLCMVISFLFLQKIAITLLGFAAINIYLIYKKQIKLSDFFIAAIIALIPMLLFSLWLTYHHLWNDFIYYNFTYNFHLKQYFWNQTFGTSTLKFLTIASLPCISFYITTPSIFKNTIFLCLIGNFITIYLFAPYAHYYTLYWFLISPILGKILNTIKQEKFIIFILILLSLNAFKELLPTKEEKKEDMTATFAYILENISKEDTAISLYAMPFFPYINIPHYYWFGYQHTAIIDVLYKKENDFDLDRIIKQTKPKFIYGTPQSDFIVNNNMKWFSYRNNLIVTKMQKFPQYKNKLTHIDSDFWQIDRDYLNQNYTKTPYPNLYIRKEN